MVISREKHPKVWEEVEEARVSLFKNNLKVG